MSSIRFTASKKISNFEVLSTYSYRPTRHVINLLIFTITESFYKCLQKCSRIDLIFCSQGVFLNKIHMKIFHSYVNCQLKKSDPKKRNQNLLIHTHSLDFASLFNNFKQTLKTLIPLPHSPQKAPRMRMDAAQHRHSVPLS